MPCHSMPNRQTTQAAPSATTPERSLRPAPERAPTDRHVPAPVERGASLLGEDGLSSVLRRAVAERAAAHVDDLTPGLSRIDLDPDYEPPEGDESSSRIGSAKRFFGGIADSYKTFKTGVEGLLTAQDNFVGRSETLFGVGEIIDLNFAGPQTAAAYGGLQWVVGSGGGTLVAPAADGTGQYTCPGDPGVVRLELQVAAGANAGDVVARRTIEVVGVEDAWMERDATQGIWHVQGSATVGFKGNIFVGPKTVSFRRATFKEGTGVANATGYHKEIGKNGEVHAATPFWVPLGPGNRTTGSQLGGTDTVATGTYAPLTDAAGVERWRKNTFSVKGSTYSYSPLYWDGGAKWKGGTFSWPIPWKYQGPGGAEHTIKTVTHYETVSAAGTASIKKAGSGTFTKQLDNPSSAY